MVVLFVSCVVRSVPGVMKDASLFEVLDVFEVLGSKFNSVRDVVEDASLVRICSGGDKLNISVWSDTVVEQGRHLKSSVCSVCSSKSAFQMQPIMTTITEHRTYSSRYHAATNWAHIHISLGLDSILHCQHVEVKR